MKTTIVVKLQYEATHNWPGVVEAMPEKTHIHFLQYPHRHLFYITMEKIVLHNDRDIEIIDFKQKVERFLKEKFDGNCNNWSCEMLAQHLLNMFDCEFVEVLEDNENGSRVYK